MVSEPEEAVLICVTVDRYPWEAPAPSERGTCSDCSVPIWVSCSALVKLPHARHICMPCGLALMLKEHESPKVLRSMLDEVADSLSPADSARLDQLLAELGTEVVDELG